VYATFDAHRTGDYGTYVYASTDYGTSWKSIAGNLPRGEVARTVTEDLKNPEVLYLGSETGLWVTLDRGRSWTRVRANLPTVPVYEITLHPRDNAMLLATHGRGVWILDQLAPFQQASQAQSAEALIYPLAPVYQRNRSGMKYYGSQGDMQFFGDNPPYGAVIAYSLKNKADSARIVITDQAGNQVRELKGDAMKDALAAGYNRVVWDLQIDPIPLPKGVSPAPAGFFGGGGDASGTPGPVVLPGDFRLSLVVNGKPVANSTVTVKGDPDIRITDQDRQRRFELLKEGQRLQARVTEASNAVRSANTQLRSLKTPLADSTTVPRAIRATYDSLVKDLEPLKKKFFIRDEDDTTPFDFSLFRQVITFKLGGVLGSVGGATAPPTATDLEQWSELRTEVPQVIDQVNGFTARLKPFYQRLVELGLYPPVPKPIEKP
jgi:hypothetical protein